LTSPAAISFALLYPAPAHYLRVCVRTCVFETKKEEEEREKKLKHSASSAA